MTSDVMSCDVDWQRQMAARNRMRSIDDIMDGCSSSSSNGASSTANNSNNEEQQLVAIISNFMESSSSPTATAQMMSTSTTAASIGRSGGDYFDDSTPQARQLLHQNITSSSSSMTSSPAGERGGDGGGIKSRVTNDTAAPSGSSKNSGSELEMVRSLVASSSSPCSSPPPGSSTRISSKTGSHLSVCIDATPSGDTRRSAKKSLLPLFGNRRKRSRSSDDVTVNSPDIAATVTIGNANRPHAAVAEIVDDGENGTQTGGFWTSLGCGTGSRSRSKSSKKSLPPSSPRKSPSSSAKQEKSGSSSSNNNNTGMKTEQLRQQNALGGSLTDQQLTPTASSSSTFDRSPAATSSATELDTDDVFTEITPAPTTKTTADVDEVLDGCRQGSDELMLSSPRQLTGNSNSSPSSCLPSKRPQITVTRSDDDDGVPTTIQTDPVWRLNGHRLSSVVQRLMSVCGSVADDDGKNPRHCHRPHPPPVPKVSISCSLKSQYGNVIESSAATNTVSQCTKFEDSTLVIEDDAPKSSNAVLHPVEPMSDHQRWTIPTRRLSRTSATAGELGSIPENLPAASVVGGKQTTILVPAETVSCRAKAGGCWKATDQPANLISGTEIDSRMLQYGRRHPGFEETAIDDDDDVGTVFHQSPAGTDVFFRRADDDAGEFRQLKWSPGEHPGRRFDSVWPTTALEDDINDENLVDRPAVENFRTELARLEDFVRSADVTAIAAGTSSASGGGRLLESDIDADDVTVLPPTDVLRIVEVEGGRDESGMTVSSRHSKPVFDLCGGAGTAREGIDLSPRSSRTASRNGSGEHFHSHAEPLKTLQQTLNQTSGNADLAIWEPDQTSPVTSSSENAIKSSRSEELLLADDSDRAPSVAAAATSSRSRGRRRMTTGGWDELPDSGWRWVRCSRSAERIGPETSLKWSNGTGGGVGGGQVGDSRGRSPIRRRALSRELKVVVVTTQVELTELRRGNPTQHGDNNVTDTASKDHSQKQTTATKVQVPKVQVPRSVRVDATPDSSCVRPRHNDDDDYIKNLDTITTSLTEMVRNLEQDPPTDLECCHTQSMPDSGPQLTSTLDRQKDLTADGEPSTSSSSPCVVQAHPVMKKIPLEDDCDRHPASEKDDSASLKSGSGTTSDSTCHHQQQQQYAQLMVIDQIDLDELITSLFNIAGEDAVTAAEPVTRLTTVADIRSPSPASEVVADIFAPQSTKSKPEVAEDDPTVTNESFENSGNGNDDDVALVIDEDAWLVDDVTNGGGDDFVGFRSSEAADAVTHRRNTSSVDDGATGAGVARSCVDKTNSTSPRRDVDVYVEKAFLESLASSLGTIIFLLLAAIIFYLLNTFVVDMHDVTGR